MGDCFQKIGDLDTTAEEASALAKSVRRWLIAEGVASGDLTDCVFDGLGVTRSPISVASSSAHADVARLALTH
ncbi:hypothetical protein [Mycobacteroides chelonae]|uniref:Uncharacterized protein n=1 Tax=Mycobacteroides chelonae TaxID=1774 RepID=A0A1S1M214_MYCCH|nr:hypothetical protein [Mycobacteroides chelonae]OHU77452.1 hypothetical protein BKG84_02630 [Mycobacteroides chelonae]QQG85819.1 hypothetical protein HBA99_09320 [Mycobacteroides chelonae]QQG90634.1 hypothetical protein HBA97_09320 [Mycobacteroides chelonae]